MVFDKLREYCNCVDNVKDSDIDELINLISAMTCWAQNPCETFLSDSRKEVVSLPDCLCDCSVFTFEPFYSPFDVDSFTFTLIEQDGINETEIPITEFAYSMVDNNFRLELPLPDCRCKPSCGCEPTYKMLIEYTAGYEEIPDCLLPIFCEALEYIKEKNACDCSECQPCEASYDSQGNIDYSKLTGRLQDYFLTVLTAQYRKQLSLISLCKYSNRLWGVVV